MLSVSTTSLPYGTVGSGYSAQLSASGGSGTYTWSATGLPAGLSVNDRTGVIGGTPTQGGTFSVTATVHDVQFEGLTASSTLPLGILQITTASPLPGASTGRPYSVSFFATGANDFMWSTANAPPGLLFGTQGSNVLSGTPTSAGNFNFSVSAYSATAGITLSQNFLINIAPVLTISTPSPLPPGMVGMPYSQSLSAAYGTTPYTYALQAGIAGNNLPAGLTLSPTGTISGTPTAAGPFVFNVTVTDAAGNQASAQLALTIAPALVILTNSLPSGMIGVSYSQIVTASGGTPPYTFSIAGTVPPGLSISTGGLLTGSPKAAGTSTVVLQVTDSLNFIATKQLTLVIAGASALLQVSTVQVSFSATIGGDAPPPQVVTIQSTNGKAVNYSAQVAGGAAPPAWLTVSPSSGAAPGALVVGVNPAGLSASPAPAIIQVTVPGDQTQSPIAISVSFSLTAGTPKLQATPMPLQFVSQLQSATTTLEKVITVDNAGGGGAVSFTTSILENSSWITSVTPSAGQTAPNAPVLLHVDVNTQALSAGSYHDVIRIASSAGTVDVPVTLFVASPGPILGLSVSGVRFPARQGSGTATPRTVMVQNLGDPASTLNWTATLLSGSDWLTLSPATGSASATNPGTLTLMPSSGTASFAAGPRYALVDVADTGTPNSHQYLTAVLDVQPASTPALPELSPAGLFFKTTGGSVPVAQIVDVYTSSSTPVSFQVAATTTDGANWLTANATTAAASTQAPGVISISVNPTGLALGIYTGSVNVSMSGTVRTVNVTLVVTNFPVNAGIVQPRVTPACTPTKLAVTQTSLGNNFAVPAGWPATLIVQLNDDCGNPVVNGAAVASFSNGDPPLSLSGDQQTPVYSATWQPSNALPQMSVTVRASAPSLQTSTAQFVGAVNSNPATPPSLAPGGVLDPFFTVATAAMVGDGLAPGSVAAAYGSGLASLIGSPGVVPLVSQYNGTFMLVGGLQAPLYYVNPGLLNVQIPFELAPNRQYSILVSSNGALTVPQTIDVVGLQPGMAAYADGSVIAQHFPSYSLVNAASPAAPGESLVIYLVGMGPTNPSVASGNPTPLQSVPAITQPTVTVDGQPANVLYAGLTPTGIGLYQINFTVPANARSGSLNLVVTQNGVQANTTTLPVASGN